jgi:hypothetical protein
MPWRSHAVAYRARSMPVENTPACPATPPIATAFWSFTSPGTGWPRQIPLGTMRERSEAGGLYIVRVMPSGPNTSRWARRSSRSPDTFSSTSPIISALRSLYSALSPGARTSGSA